MIYCQQFCKICQSVGCKYVSKQGHFYSELRSMGEVTTHHWEQRTLQCRPNYQRHQTRSRPENRGSQRTLAANDKTTTESTPQQHSTRHHNGQALSSWQTPVSHVSDVTAQHNLSSANHCLLANPRYHLSSYGRWDFSVASPNFLPDNLRNTYTSFCCFKCQLKMFLLLTRTTRSV